MTGSEVGSGQFDSSVRGPPTEKEHLQQQLEDENDLEGEEYEEVEGPEAIQTEEDAAGSQNSDKPTSQVTEKQQ